jgi:hypothetical protein
MENVQLDTDNFFEAMESVINGHNDEGESTSDMDFGIFFSIML